jgi:hypothetical protein
MRTPVEMLAPGDRVKLHGRSQIVVAVLPVGRRAVTLQTVDKQGHAASYQVPIVRGGH